MQPVTRLCLVRHGETSWNAVGRLQGHRDIGLNASGVHQAQACARHLAHQPVRAVLCSDLARARVTAEIIARPHGLHVQLEPRLRERHLGAFQGLTHDEASQRYPAIHPAVRARKPDAAPPGGESLQELARRVTHALESIAHLHGGQTVVCVAHGGVLDIAYRLASGMPLEAPRDFLLHNGSCNWLLFRSGHWHIDHWDDRPTLQHGHDEYAT